MKQKSFLKKAVLWIFSFCLLLMTVLPASVPAAAPVRLVVDGNDITSLSAPFIENDRTMVPARFIAEAIGAEVIWDATNRTVRMTKGNRSVFFRIGSYLVEYDDGAFYQLSDVAPRIVNDRSYVPVRLISNAFGVGIDWDANTRTVLVDSKKTSSIQPFFDVKITSHQTGSIISGKTTVSVSVGEKHKADAKEMRLLLLDADTASGFVVFQTTQPGTPMTYIPKPENKGKKVLVAALYDAKGVFVGGDSIRVDINVIPEVKLTGIDIVQLINGPVTVRPSINFLATHVKYEMTSMRTGRTTTADSQDPEGSFTWTPVMEQNGACIMKVTAYDVSGQAYESPPLNVTVTMDRKLALAGVSPGMTVSRKVSLIASRNFDVNETTYIMRDVPSGNETILSKQPWGSYEWFPGPEQSGEKELFVRVINAVGTMYQSSPVKVTVDGSPKLILQGVGPNQVVTGQPKLTVSGNVSMDSVSYILTNSTTGVKRILASNLGMSDTYTYTPQQGDAGKVSIMAEGTYQGRKISSGSIAFTVYLGRIYGPEAIIQKDLYLDFASGMAKTSWELTGMSAALQTAQAILETGWGQGVPVDKYSGQLSYNLFGIKGKGTNGSVISNTWEVYDGITYHIDDEFRAYRNVQESWDDHKSLLLNASRYQPFRDVMYSSTLGAWAIKRSGYATDPLYPTKLMRIIRQYGLEELDRTGI